MIRRLIAALAVMIVASPALADFTITGPVTFATGSGFSHAGATVSLSLSCDLVANAGCTPSNNDWTGTNTYSAGYGRYREVLASDDLLLTDCGRSIVYAGSDPITITTIANAAPAGKVCPVAVIQDGTGAVSFAAGIGTTLTAATGCTKAFGKGSVVSLVVTGNNPSDWKLGGSCAP